jgi:deoxyribodipyrimidine photolyase-related protein
LEEIKKTNCKSIFIKEDFGLCTDHKHHKLKILMFLISMREYRDYLVSNGFKVIYHSIDDSEFKTPYLKTLSNEIKNNSIESIAYYQIEDNSFKNEFDKFKSKSTLDFVEYESPMFQNLNL